MLQYDIKYRYIYKYICLETGASCRNSSLQGTSDRPNHSRTKACAGACLKGIYSFNMILEYICLDTGASCRYSSLQGTNGRPNHSRTTACAGV